MRLHSFALSLVVTLALSAASAAGWSLLNQYGAIPAARARSAGAIFNGGFVVYGGYDPAHSVWLQDTSSFNLATNTWSALASPQQAHSEPHMCTVGTTYLVLVSTPGFNVYTQTAETWSKLYQLPAWNSPFSSTCTGYSPVANSILVTSPRRNELYLFDVTSGAQTTLALTATPALQGTVSDIFANGATVLMVSSRGQLYTVAINVGAKTATATAGPAMPTPYLGLEMMGTGVLVAMKPDGKVMKYTPGATSWVDSGKLVLPANQVSQETFYPAATGTQMHYMIPYPNNTVVRAELGGAVPSLVVVMPDQEVPISRDNAQMASTTTLGIVYGGTIVREASGTTWLLDFATLRWRVASGTVSPPGRTEHALTASADNVFLFGGRSTFGAVTNDLWVFSTAGESWSQLTPTTKAGPASRAGASLVVMNATHLVLYGGYTNGAYFKDMWSFNIAASAWTLVTFDVFTKLPGVRYASLTQHPGDPTTIVLFGGQSEYGTASSNVVLMHLGNLTVETTALHRQYARSAHTAVQVGSELLIVGGLANDARPETQSFRIHFTTGTPTAELDSTIDTPAGSPPLLAAFGATIVSLQNGLQQTLNHTRGCTPGFSNPPRCVPCPVGTYWTVGGACSACELGTITRTFGSTSPTQCIPRAFNPIERVLPSESQQPEPYQSRSSEAVDDATRGTIIGVSVTGGVLLLLMLFMAFGTHEQHDFYLKNIDLFFDESHHVKQGPMMKRDTVCGGIFAVIFVGLIITFSYRASRPYALDNLEETVTAVPTTLSTRNVSADIAVIVKAFNYTALCTASTVSVTLSSVSGTPNVTATQETGSSDCTVSMLCSQCRILTALEGSIGMKLVFTDPAASAEALSVSVQSNSAYPGQVSRVTNGFVPARGKVLRGPEPSQITIKAFPDFMDDETVSIGGSTTGYQFESQGTLMGSTSDHLTWAQNFGVGVDVDLARADVVLLINRKNKEDIVLLFSALAGIFVGLFGVMAMVSKGAEKVYYVYLTHKEDKEKHKQDSFLSHIKAALREVFAQLQDDPYDKRRKIGPRKLSDEQKEIQRQNINEVLYSILDAIYGEGTGPHSLGRKTFSMVARQIFGACVDEDQLGVVFRLIDEDKSETLEVDEISNWLMEILFNPECNMTLSDTSAAMLHLQFYAQLIIKNMDVVETSGSAYGDEEPPNMSDLNGAAGDGMYKTRTTYGSMREPSPRITSGRSTQNLHPGYGGAESREPTHDPSTNEPVEEHEAAGAFSARRLKRRFQPSFCRGGRNSSDMLRGGSFVPLSSRGSLQASNPSPHPHPQQRAVMEQSLAMQMTVDTEDVKVDESKWEAASDDQPEPQGRPASGHQRGHDADGATHFDPYGQRFNQERRQKK